MSAFERQKLSASIAIDKGPKTNHQQVKAAFGTERMRITPIRKRILQRRLCSEGGGMFQFLKRHIIKAISSLRRGGRHCHFGVVFQVGGESERAFFAFFTTPPKGHDVASIGFRRVACG